MKHTLLLLFCLFSFMTATSSELTIYPVTKDIIYTSHNDDYTVKVRVPGGKWQDLFEYNVRVDMDAPQQASMVQFDFSGQVEVMIKKNNGLIQKVDVRPLITKMEPIIKGNVLFLTLNKPQKLSIEFNGDRLHNLHLFANEPEKEVPLEGDSNVIFFGPGIHKPDDLPGIQFNIPSNKTVYLAPGAILKGKLVVDKAENVRIIGRGIIDQAQRGIEVTHSKNVLIEGITVVNPDHYTVYGGESQGLTIRNLKSFSCKGWSDGIDLMSCKDVLIEDVFLRNSDDCIAIYGHRWDYYGDARNITVKNSILWADVAHPINIGLHGNTEGKNEVIENLNFKNIDILEHDEDDPEYQGCMSICAGDKNLVRNVTFENIRVESIQEGQLIHLKVVYNSKYSAAPGKGIENIQFKNIYYQGYGENPSLIEGYDSKCIVQNIGFDNIVINGVRARSLTEAGIVERDGVRDIHFK
ncbi:MAG: glycosyl hydrolase family 28 protein [Bacteroidota bacterium]|nr:glycosyl hydrolase family 28 protein [Bacteroidota bacterium]